MSLYALKFAADAGQDVGWSEDRDDFGEVAAGRGRLGRAGSCMIFRRGWWRGRRIGSAAKWPSGPLAGKTLHQLVGELGKDLYGNVPLVGPHGQFPILIKFLDAGQDLSVQVHPDEAYAKANPGAHLKNEAWFVVQADAGVAIAGKGLKPGVTRANRRLGRRSRTGSVESSDQFDPGEGGGLFLFAERDGACTGCGDFGGGGADAERYDVSGV